MTDFVIVEARDLKSALKVAIDVVKPRNSIPILGHVRLCVDLAGFRVIATDLDIEASIYVDAIDRSDVFDICLDARRLYEIAAAAGVMPMKIEATDGGATITLDDDAAIYELTALPVADFPTMNQKREAEIETFTNGMFASMLGKVKFCISTDETRYYLNGVAWQIAEGGRWFVSTDGYRLAACQYSKEGGNATTRIIPRKAVGIITKCLTGKDVKIYATDCATRIDIVSPGLVIRTKLIDGHFPDWSRVVPDKLEFGVKLKKQEVVTAIIQSTAISSERTRAIKFTGKDNRLAVECHSPEFGKASVRTSTAWPKGADHIGFNRHYFRLMAENCQEDIDLSFDNPGSPVLIRDSDETMTRVLMPMRVSR